MNTEVLLHKANRTVKFRRRPVKSGSNIDGELKKFLKKVARPAVKNVSVPDVFEQIVGGHIAANCRIHSITAGVMKVHTKPGPFMFELSSQAGQIIEQLKQQCPSANIRQIRLVCAE